MITEIEQEFFKVFGIEPKVKCDIIKTANMCICFTCPRYKNIDGDTGECQNLKYPEITDRKLLELICILNSYYSRTMQCCTMLYSSKIDNLKEEILKEFIDLLKQYTELEFLKKDRDEREEENWIKTNIQQLFKEEE